MSEQCKTHTPEFWRRTPQTVGHKTIFTLRGALTNEVGVLFIVLKNINNLPIQGSAKLRGQERTTLLLLFPKPNQSEPEVGDGRAFVASNGNYSIAPGARVRDRSVLGEVSPNDSTRAGGSWYGMVMKNST